MRRYDLAMASQQRVASEKTRRAMSHSPEKPFLTGKHIYLRPLEREDLAGDYRHWVNDHDVTKFIESGNFPLTDEDMLAFYEKHSRSSNSVLFAIVETASGKHIGNAQVKDIHWIHRHASRGILIGDKDCWGKGYGAEVAELLTQYVFECLNLNKFKSSTVAENKGIQKLNEKLGYKIDGVAREEFYCDGRYYDRVDWSILRSDYFAAKDKTVERRE
jgi:RimJ/RimL family protein N-acetyltransferase